MNQILKRLEIIRSSILIEDDETIELQVARLEQLELNDSVQHIIKLINNADFEKVVGLIENYLKGFESLIAYEDEELQGLRLELKVCERELLMLSCKVEEYHAVINEFNTRYHLELGALIEEILMLKEEYYEYMYKHAKQEEYEYEYFEAKKDHETFKDEFKKYDFDTLNDLDNKEKNELKRLYKKASKLCHPDIVEANRKEQAEDIFKELNHAYQQKDIKAVSSILDQLLKGEEFNVSSESISNKDLLRKEIEIVKRKIKKMKLEIESLKRDDTFVLVSKIDDLDYYLYQTKEALLREKESIVSMMRQYSKMV